MIERKIIIGIITSTDFCKRIKDIWNDQLLESSTARKIASWSWEYYLKYDKAPGREIETIFYSKIQDKKFPKDIAEEIEQEILPALSEEYTAESFDVTFHVDEAYIYLSNRHIKVYIESIEALLFSNQLEEAEKLIHSFKPLGSVNERMDTFIKTVTEIRQQERKRPLLLMSPWLRSSQLTIIYGQFGSGKSLLSISIAYLLGLRMKEAEHQDAYIGKWYVNTPTGCLYIDGELGEVEMEERIKGFEWLGKQRIQMKILSVPEYQLETEDSFYLSMRANQQKILRWLTDNPAYKLVVLDSASTLFGLEDENSNSEWNNKVNPFLRDLRALDIACILLHHSGKDSKRGLRGASAMGAMAHNIFRLTNHEGKDPDDGEAWFVINKDKQRSGGKSFPSFGVRYYQDNGDTRWEKTEA